METEREFIQSVHVLDNGSQDGTLNDLISVKKDYEIDLIESPVNEGFSEGFNKLIQHSLKHSDADYFMILNNDTLFTEGMMPSILKVCSPNSVVSPMIVWEKDRETIIQSAGDFDDEMIKMKNHFYGKKINEVDHRPHEIGQTDGCCFVIHRKWFERGFLFNPEYFMYYEDMDLFKRLRNHNVEFIYQAEAILYHKEYGSSGGREKKSPLRNYYFYRNRLYYCSQFLNGFKKYKKYYMILRFALEKYKEEFNSDKQAANSILKGCFHFFINKMGKQNYL